MAIILYAEYKVIAKQHYILGTAIFTHETQVTSAQDPPKNVQLDVLASISQLPQHVHLSSTFLLLSDMRGVALLSSIPAHPNCFLSSCKQTTLDEVSETPNNSTYLVMYSQQICFTYY